MPEAKKSITKEKARAILMRPRLRFEPKAPEALAAETWKRAAANKLKIGTKMPDGTIFAGRSPATARPMYVAPQDASICMDFDRAAAYAASLDMQGHQDWRVPAGAELLTLFMHRAAIGGFDETGDAARSWYWSSTCDRDDPGQAIEQGFRSGSINFTHKSANLSVRCVRG